MKLSLKQQKFADEYIKSGNVSQAAIIAGYSKAYSRTHAYKLLEKASVKVYVSKRLEELKKESIAQQDEMLQYLTSVMRGETTEQTLCGTGEGTQKLITIEVSAKDRIKAAELLGKRHVMWTDKQEITQRNIEITIGEYNDDD